MNRNEALRFLGLDEDATSDDIKTAYKEMAQILHPDRFTSSRKVQDRASEQFKNLQEAYEVLKGKGSNEGAAYSGSTRPYSATSELEARLAGIAGARTQLVAERDTMMDERRNSFILLAFGIVVALLLRRVPIGLAIGTTALVWGIVKLISAQSTISNLNEHIKKLNEERKKIAQELDEL